jgi:hypothetical protein
MMRRSISNILRRIANRLSPQRVESVTPLEWLSTPELVQELIKRHDVTVIFLGQRIKDGLSANCTVWARPVDVENIVTLLRATMKEGKEI